MVEDRLLMTVCVVSINETSEKGKVEGNRCIFYLLNATNPESIVLAALTSASVIHHCFNLSLDAFPTDASQHKLLAIAGPSLPHIYIN